MATSAFKSMSRRATTSSSSTNKQQSRKHKNSPPRRSRSVSASSRTHFDTTTEFQNKRDNPLFWVDEAIDEIPKFVVDSKASSNGSVESRRGRSVSRNSTSGGRSLSRVDPGRQRRSASRRHSESEREQESEILTFRSKSKVISNGSCSLLGGKSKLVRSASDLSEVLKGCSTWSSQHPAFENSDDSASQFGSRRPCWDDGISNFSEAEEKTIIPVSVEKKTPSKDISGTPGVILETVRSEVRQAICDMQYDLKNAMLSRSNVIHSSIISDVVPELEIPNTVGLVRDMRDEFSRELEECEERTRKLRAELAVEEHREIELNKILNDIVPEPKTPLVQNTRAVRKASFERKKMSKRLEEEALAFFDECVSISTFEDSDFSSLEDLPPNMVSIDGADRERVGLPGVPSRASIACSFKSEDDVQRSAIEVCNEDSNLSVNCSSGRKFSLEEDIRNYVKILSEDYGREINDSRFVSTSHQNNRAIPEEKLLLDRLTFRTKIESGSMLLCDGGLGLSSVLW